MVTTTRQLALAVGGAVLAAVLIRRAMKRRTPCPEGGRSLGAAETAIVKISRFCQGSMRVALVLRLRGSQPLAVDTLQAAVNALAQRHPVLRSVVRRVAGQTVEDEEYIVEPATECQVAVKLAERGIPWQEEWEQLQHVPLELGGPLAQVVLIPNSHCQESDEVIEIILAVEHAFCDGISIGHLGHELLLAIGAVSCGADPSTVLGPPLQWQPVMEDLAAETVGGGGLLGLFCRGWLILSLIRMASGAVPVTAFPRADTDFGVESTSTTSFQHIELTREETLTFMAACRKHHVTVTAAVGAVQLQALTAYIAAHDSRLGKPESGLPVATVWGADTRRWYNPQLAQDHVSFHVGGIPAFTAQTKDANVWELAAAAREHLVRMTEARIPLAIALIVGSMYEAEAHAGPQKPPVDKPPLPFTTSVSSWGRMPFLEVYGTTSDDDSVEAGGWVLDAVVPVVNMSYTPFPLSLVVTSAGRLTVALLGGQPMVTQTCLQALHNEILLRLRHMANDQ